MDFPIVPQMHPLSRLQTFAHAMPPTWGTSSLFLSLAKSYSFGRASIQVPSSRSSPCAPPSPGLAHTGS